tara:strand:- start:2041 stop:2598 length:558 start_codon:yes stop_codon:yes gene_type:complete
MKNQLIIVGENTLKILEKKTWNSLKLQDVFKKTKNVKKETFKKITDKKDLLTAINSYIDDQLKQYSNNIEQSNEKDMFFEILMTRFDILQKYRRGILSIFHSFKRKPQELLYLLPSFIDSMIFMAGLGKISIYGIKGNIKIKGLLIVYFSSFLVWKNDNNQSLEKTMTSLNVYLDRADKLLKIFN